MSNSVKVSIAMIAVATLIVVVVALFTREDTPQGTNLNRVEAAEVLVREDSPRLSEGTEAVFVEYLDFECEACGALYPVMEDLRERYGDRVTFVVRYMPLHGNSLGAALAAEAAANQGQFEAMYQRLFETQAEWGHQSASQEATFFRYAEDLGLDMTRFRAAYDDPATLARVQQSEDDGRALGVTGTPSFFLDGERLRVETVTDLEASIEAALGD